MNTNCIQYFIFFFFNDTATTEIYTLSLHDALPILFTLANAVMFKPLPFKDGERLVVVASANSSQSIPRIDRKSTRLNSSHSQISYAVFCLKKKNIIIQRMHKCILKTIIIP